MNRNIDPNLTNAEQSSLEEETTESNGNERNDTAAIKTKNFLGQKGKPVLIADGTHPPLPPTPEMSPEEIEIV